MAYVCSAVPFGGDISLDVLFSLRHPWCAGQVHAW